MFIYPTDGVIASMISTQTRMTDSEHSSQLFIHAAVNMHCPPSPAPALVVRTAHAPEQREVARYDSRYLDMIRARAGNVTAQLSINIPRYFLPP